MKRKFIKKTIEDRWNLTLLENYENYSSKEKYFFKCNKCGYIWEQRIRQDYNLACPCYYHSDTRSKGEQELFNLFLTTGLIVEHNNTKVLDGKELDIYFPDLDFAIEYDGGFWHTQKENEEKDRLCAKKKIKLLRIKDKDFNRNRTKVLRFIRDYFNKTFHMKITFHPKQINK